MNRRRMMMLQQNKGFELVYNAVSGILPQNTEGWSWRQGQYNGNVGIGGVKLENGLLVVKTNHIYENVLYYPTDNLTADKSEASVTVDTWAITENNNYAKSMIRIGLTDGIHYAICGVFNDSFKYGTKLNNNILRNNGTLNSISYEPPQKFTLKAKLNNGKAEYYINDELIAVEDSLPTVDTAKYGEQSDYFVKEPMNFIGVGINTLTSISNMTYKEW